MGILNHGAVSYHAGDVFYYRAQKKVYCGVFLFHQDAYDLIALSEEITVPVQSIQIEDVLNLTLYTLAWFSDTELLMPRRLHRIGAVEISGDYSNRAGLLIDGQGCVLLKNVGQRGTWNHTYRAFYLRDAVVKDALTVRFVPKTRR